MRLHYFITLLLALPLCSAAQTYKCQLPDGKVSYQDQPCQGTATGSRTVLQATRSVAAPTASARDQLPAIWKTIKPGISAERLLELVPQGKLKTQPAGTATVTAGDFEYGGTKYEASFEFKDKRLTSFHLFPASTFLSLDEAQRQLARFRSDALAAGGEKVSSTIDFGRKNAFGKEIIKAWGWELEVSCMPHSSRDVADFLVNSRSIE
jgi:hypothetical protein